MIEQEGIKEAGQAAEHGDPFSASPHAGPRAQGAFPGADCHPGAYQGKRWLRTVIVPVLGIVLLVGAARAQEPAPDSSRSPSTEASQAPSPQGDPARLAAMEADIRRLAATQPTLNNQALWKAGEQIHYAITLQVIGVVLSTVLTGLAAFNDDSEFLVAGSVAGVGLTVFGTIKMYGAGTELKRASTIKGPTRVTP